METETVVSVKVVPIPAVKTPHVLLKSQRTVDCTGETGAILETGMAVNH